jgi:hypothetical protein
MTNPLSLRVGEIVQVVDQRCWINLFNVQRPSALRGDDAELMNSSLTPEKSHHCWDVNVGASDEVCPAYIVDHVNFQSVHNSMLTYDEVRVKPPVKG